VSAGSDVVELLLPDADEARRARARRLATCLRLLANDASPRRAARVGLGLDGARAELARGTRERLLAALCELCARHLAAVRSADAFLTLGERAGDAQAAWSVLQEERADLPWLAGVPEPGESPLEVAGRLLACARRLGLDAGELALWEARRRALALGPREGELAFRALLAQAPGAAALCGALECLLERGAVRRARALLDAAPAALRAAAEVARLAAWIAVLADGAPPRAAVPPAERVPAGPAALRRLGEPFRSAFAGRAARGPTRRLPSAAERGELGAALLAAFALERGGTARCLRADAAPARRAGLEAWCGERVDAARQAGELEHAALTRGEPCVAHAGSAGAPPGVQDARAARAAAVVPVLDADGEALGWLRLEFEHHLVPSPAALRELARAWRATLRAARPADETPRTARHALADAPPPRSDDPRGAVLAALVAELGLKLAQRRWWGVVPHAGGALLVAEGGGALEDWRARAGGGRALQRALQTAGQVRFDEGDARLAVSADARSGAVLPLRHGAHLAGLLAVESTRRRDLIGLDARLARERRPWALELRLAGFRAWHAARWGVEPAFDVEIDDTRRWLEDLLAAARAEGALALCGAPSTGRRVLSRWTHFESARRDGPWLEHACGTLDGQAEAQRLFADDGLLHAARAGTLHLCGVERLAPALQSRLGQWLGTGDAPSRARLVVALAQPLRAGALQGELARRLSRLELFVPTLAERRGELPCIAAGMLRRFARELGRGEVRADDEVTAWLWRQAWPGNLRELEDLLYRLVLCTPRRELALDDLREAARRSRLELVARVPSRDVDPAWIRAALAVTRTRCGGENKTRAALYLGWDPDTLARARATPAEPG
jgi:hypothetical protein